MITKEILAQKAYNMFRDWAINVKIKYPELNLMISDETLLVNNLTTSIKKARESLLKKENLVKMELPGYDIGFMLGFIGSNLNTRWHYEYIIKQSKDYKEFIAIKAIKLYLEFASLANIRITNLYKHLLAMDSNIEDINPFISYQELQGIPLSQENDFIDNAILTTLNNKINQYLNNYLLLDILDFMEPCEKYFSNSEIKSLCYE